MMEEWEKNLAAPTTWALQIAARCWCDEETGTRVMDEKLAVAFAMRLDALRAHMQYGGELDSSAESSGEE